MKTVTTVVSNATTPGAFSREVAAHCAEQADEHRSAGDAEKGTRAKAVAYARAEVYAELADMLGNVIFEEPAKADLKKAA